MSKDLEQDIKEYSNKALDQRKSWYSPAADAYNKVRPRYPKPLIDRVIELAQLPDQANILELGCGPGIATVAFAEKKFSIVGIEPNLDFCQLAEQNCAQYPKVEIQNTSFEEWDLQSECFDAVLAATSIHWIPAEVVYPKAAEALRENSSLILLWNLELLPHDEITQILQEVYQIHTPSLKPYERKETQIDDLNYLGQMSISSGRFKNLVSEQVVNEVVYSVDDYLALLSTYSPYIALDQLSRDALFDGLRIKINQVLGEQIQLSQTSAFHVAQKV